MSHPGGPLEGEQSRGGSGDPTPKDGLFASLRRHVDTWAKRYVEMRVSARTDC